jgi:protein TonB
LMAFYFNSINIFFIKTLYFMLITNKKRNGLLVMIAFTALIGITACKDSNSDRNAAERTINSPADTTAVAADNTATAATTKKTRKGKTSVTWTVSDRNSTKVVMDKDGVYSRPSTMPMYPGGETALSGYVSDNISYDQAAIDADASGTVMISFVVDEKGKIEDAKVMGKGVDANLDREAVRVVEQMPAWTPGTVKGKNVKTRLTLPIVFQIEEQ